MRRNIAVRSASPDGPRAGYRARDLVRCMIDMCHGLDLEVTAPVVQSHDAVERLWSMGCGAARGFICTPALPDAEFAQWLERTAP